MKAPGFDGTFNIILKHLGPKAFTLLTNVFNRCLQLSYFPSAWKRAKVIPILKPGKDPSIAKNYRPISLLASLSKIFEGFIYDRILKHSEENHILLDTQFGFRRGHSTVHQLQRLTNNIRRNKDLSKTTVVALLDIEKAFDNVWHNGLTHKLLSFNFPTYLVKIVHNYLQGRSSQVCLHGTLSDCYPVNAGVPQGSILGPILYNLYTSDIPSLPEDGKLSLFADDSAISYSGRIVRRLVEKLQTGLNHYTTYLNDWKIRVNAAKTQTIIFPHSKSPRLIPTTHIQLQGVQAKWASEVRYLGLTLDQKLIFRAHVDEQVTRSTVLLKKLYPLICRKARLSKKNKLLVYKQIVQPMILYASPIWMNCAQTHLKKLQIVQNRFLRMILDAPWRTRITDLHRMANLVPLADQIQTISEKFRNKALASNVVPIRELFPA